VLVGAVIAGSDGVRGWLYHLAVLPHYRRRATRLVRAAESKNPGIGLPEGDLADSLDNTQVVAF
jgi:hypothetical protein